MRLKNHIDASWTEILEEEIKTESFKSLELFLSQAFLDHRIYPPVASIFKALNLSPINQLKAVIIGQDPYHGSGQANGLAFSVDKGIKIPPSLKNIFLELCRDIHCPMPKSGDLSPWAKQGVLLLNTALTVRESQPGSHSGMGWEDFTDGIIKEISQRKSNIIFLLWGKHAEKKESLIDAQKHHILKTSHPSPFSVNKGFRGCCHFSKTNQLLKTNHLEEINWML